MKVGRRKVQKERMWRNFIEVAVELIESEGIENITIRKVADKVGYSASTAYNYFQELSHLIFFAAMRFTKGYIEDLPHYMDRGTNTIDKWLYSWECFCKHSFENPKIYSIIFINNLGAVPEDLIDHYYTMYKMELVGLPEPVQDIILQHTLDKRSSLYVQGAVKEGLIKPGDVSFITDVTLLIWQGMMTSLLNKRTHYSTSEALRKTLSYIYESVINVVPSDKKHVIRYRPDDIAW